MGTVLILMRGAHAGMVWQLHPLHLRFLLLPGAFSLLCFSEGKCFVTRDWNTPLKERGREEKERGTFILTAKRPGQSRAVVAVKMLLTFLIWPHYSGQVLTGRWTCCVWSNTLRHSGMSAVRGGRLNKFRALSNCTLPLLFFLDEPFVDLKAANNWRDCLV